MENRILAVTADQKLQEEIQHCLDEVGGYQLICVGSEAEALVAVNGEEFDAAILDAEISDIPFVPFTRNLVAAHPQMKLLIIPPGNNILHPVIKGVVFNGFISKPLEATELRDALKFAISPSDETPDIFVKDAPEIDSEVWEEEKSDEDPLISAALAEASTPVEDILPAGWLREVDLNALEIHDDADIPIPPPIPSEAATEETDISDEKNAEEHKITPEESPPPLRWVDPESESEESLQLQEQEGNQDIASEYSFAVTKRLMPLPDVMIEPGAEVDIPGVVHDEEPPLLELPTNPDASEELPPALSVPPEESSNFLDDGSPPPELALLDASYQLDGSEPGTSPMGIQGLRLKYTCVLIPRAANQYLTRDLSERLSFILPQIHLSHGWRVTGISIRPTHLQWHVSFPASVSPLEAVTLLKKRISAHLYTNFPKLVAENRDSDFWAPGYLILSGNQPLSSAAIQEFILRTRQTSDIQMTE